MKNFLPVIVFFFCVITNYAQQKKILQTDVQNMNLKGAVKSIRETEFNVTISGTEVAKDPNIEPSKNRYLEFDRAGNLVKEVWYNKDGTEYSRVEFKYTKPGLVAEKKTYKNGYVDSRIAYEYDENDYMKLATTYDGGDMIQNRSEYNSQILEDNSRVTIIKSENFPGYSHVVYNKQGLIDYTEWGKTKETAAKTLSYTYNPRKQIESKQFFTNGKPKDMIHFEYDREGNVSKDSTTNTAFPTVKTYDYTYDIRGNFTRKISKGGAGSTMVERKLMYY